MHPHPWRLQMCSGIAMHWTLGGAAPAACNYASTAKPTAGSNLLHVALESNAGGWIGAAFPRSPNTMVPADSIIGWMAANGSASVGAYYLGVGCCCSCCRSSCCRCCCLLLLRWLWAGALAAADLPLLGR
jgi:hypothetical protein